MIIAILGGGQLGRMFIQNALNLHHEVWVLDNDKNAPCHTIAHKFVQGDITDFETVYQFAKDADIITIEIENVNTNALQKLEKEGKKVFPQPHIIELIQDKRAQKIFYQENNFPTADFVLVEDKNDLQQHLAFLPAFQKLGKGGYDGKGVQLLHNEADFAKAFTMQSLLEKKVELATEIAILVARNVKGEISLFPTVEMHFNDTLNLVDYVFSPANITQKHEQIAKELAIRLVEKLNFVGILAIEMFVDIAGEILINEIAPRPHNSGHHTIEGNYSSQFEAHLRAILDYPLGDTGSREYAGMINLIGEDGHEGIAKYEGLENALAMQGVYVHLYGKKMTKAGRKMGHITVLAKDYETLKEKINSLRKMVKVIA